MAKRKLSEQQKEWLKNLEWYVQNIMKDYACCKKDFEDVVDCGKYAVFSKRSDFWDDENKRTIPGGRVILGANNKNVVECMLKFNCSEFYHVVDLEFLMFIKELKRSPKPSFANFIQKELK